jgi:hypothetical protein
MPIQPMVLARKLPAQTAFAKRNTQMRERYILAEPYPWPYNGDLRPANTALVVIDMQTDCCGVGGYVERMGYDLSLTRAPIAPIATGLAAMRRHCSSVEPV